MENKQVDNDNIKTEGRNSHKNHGDDGLVVPIDHGWAWFVMFGAFVNTTMIMFFIRSMSILFIQFLEKYQESATMTTMALGFASAMFALCNIFGTVVLLHRFEVRTLVVTGSVLNFFSIFLIAFAPSMIVIDIMMACMGLSHGLMFVPQMTLIGRYFKNRLSFATAFVNLGLSIATMAGPPLTQFFIDMYGLRGAIMMLAVMNMNCIPASMLLRPISAYKKQQQNIYEENKVQVGTETEQEAEVNTAATEINQNNKETTYNKRNVSSKEEIVSLITCSPNMKHHIHRSVSESLNTSATIASSSPDAHIKSHTDITRSDRRESLVIELIDRISVSNNIRYLSDPNIFIEASVSTEKISSNSDHLQMEDECGDSLIVRSNSNEIKDVTLEYVSNEFIKQESNEKKAWLTKVRQSISKSIYFHPLAILLLLASGLGNHSLSIVAYMPAAGKENGLTDDQIPYLITVIGICDLVSKLAIGVFADLGFVKRIHIACAAQIVVGTLTQFVRFFKGFGLMIVLQVGLGLTIGVLHAMVAVITVDILGVKHMGHIMAGYFLVNGILMTIEHIVIGTIKDVTGSFIIGYNYIGCFILLSAFLFLLEPLVAKLKPAPKN